MIRFLKITLIRSLAGKPEKQRKILRAIKLTKINKTVKFKDSPSIRGIVNAIPHLVKFEIEEVAEN